jgi:triosephosphate isomerase
MRRAFIGGNWKMFLNRSRGVELAKSLVDGTRDIEDRDVLICPAFPLLSDVAKAVQGSRIQLGAQNLYFEKEGAFTGEVSAEMILSCGCSHVIIGHSERRHIFNEKNDMINKKVLAALASGLKPVLCVGELLEEREAGKTQSVVKGQVGKGLEKVKPADLDHIVIAYEPVWAIGTGKTATPEDADSVHSFIRKTISGLYSNAIAGGLRIIYGGSVKPDNIDGLMAKENIDGVLVGGASLKPDSFLRIVKFEIRG